jgi:hypothetical protein
MRSLAELAKLISPIATTYKPSQINEAINTVSVVGKILLDFRGRRRLCITAKLAANVSDGSN